jgi:tetratricopeptide (TPR) repeat protein
LSTLPKEQIKNIYFLLAARIPEFNWFLENELSDDARLNQVINIFFTKNYRYEVPHFTSIDEVKGFVKKYEHYLHSSIKNESIEEIAKMVFKDTNGHPIMVKFACFNEGLRTHVNDMYLSHLVDKYLKKPDTKKIEAVIICSLFDISSLQLTIDFSKKLGIQTAMIELDNTIVKESKDGIWKTIHPKWDLELLKFLFNDLQLKSNLESIKNAFSNAVYNILNKYDNYLSILDTIYFTIAVNKIIDICILEELISYEKIESELKDENSKYHLLAFTFGISYHHLNKDNQSLIYYDKAMTINKNDKYAALINKGVSLDSIGNFDEAIDCYDRALEINPYFVDALYNKGKYLSNDGNYVEAIGCYDRALKIKPDYALAQQNRLMAQNDLRKSKNSDKKDLSSDKKQEN